MSQALAAYVRERGKLEAALESEEGEDVPGNTIVLDFLEEGAAVDLHWLILRFVELHSGRHRQRTPEWLAEKTRTIGGSEMAALMRGYNPYSSVEDIVASKAKIKTWGDGSIACWWGTLFESAIENYVEIDCGTTLAGTDISVPAPRGSGLRGFHANSPDGYGVVTLAEDNDGGISILTTDTPPSERRDARQVIALWEFKCPYRRQPKGVVPKHYKPQIWSGLALSPIAHVGVFVDAVFRKCALWNLGPGPGYDWTYHRERKVAAWTAPIAWGVTGIYAPRLDTPRTNAANTANTANADFVENGLPTDAAYEAWLLHYKYFGIHFKSPAEAAKAGEPFGPDPIDFGDCEKSVFEVMMGHLDKRRFSSEHVGPCFPDGRGADLRGGRAIGAAIDDLAARAPAHSYLLGILPWKMLEVDYVLMGRRPGFLAEVAPLVRGCLSQAEKIQDAENPGRAYHEYLSGQQQKKWAAGKAPQGIPEKDLQDLFDIL